MKPASRARRAHSLRRALGAPPAASSAPPSEVSSATIAGPRVRARRPAAPAGSDGKGRGLRGAETAGSRIPRRRGGGEQRGRGGVTVRTHAAGHSPGTQGSRAAATASSASVSWFQKP